MGKQPLYDVEVDLVDMVRFFPSSPSLFPHSVLPPPQETGQILHSVSRKVGFRRLRVLQEPLRDEPGRTFLFEVNNVPFFVGGSNWIPADSLLTNATEERYRQLLGMVVEGNQNMIRVWGGGVYEDESFYSICVSPFPFFLRQFFLFFRPFRSLAILPSQDEFGILVWQDVMFACGSYPAHIDGFRENVRLEVEGVVKRLRFHACLAIFAGNNED
jgi:beta-mannosidase